MFSLSIGTGAWSQAKVKYLRICSSNPIRCQNCGTCVLFGNTHIPGETQRDLYSPSLSPYILKYSKEREQRSVGGVRALCASREVDAQHHPGMVMQACHPGTQQDDREFKASLLIRQIQG